MTLQLCRFSLAFIWIYQGIVPKWLGPHEDELAMNQVLGASHKQAMWIAYGGGALEVLLGLAPLAVSAVGGGDRGIVPVRIFAGAAVSAGSVQCGHSECGDSGPVSDCVGGVIKRFLKASLKHDCLRCSRREDTWSTASIASHRKPGKVRDSGVFQQPVKSAIQSAAKTTTRPESVATGRFPGRDSR